MPARYHYKGDSLQLLERVALFDKVSPEHLARLAAASRVHDLPANHTLFHTGDTIRKAYVLISGTIKRMRILEGGGEEVVELLSSQQVFGLGELFSAKVYGTFAATVTACVVIDIAADAFCSVVRDDLTLSARMLEIMARRQCAIEFEVVSRHAHTGTQRVLDYLIEIAGDRLATAGETTVKIGPSKRVVASRMGLTPETFSRTLRKLSESGAIVVDGRNVHIQIAALSQSGSPRGTQPLRFPRKSKEAARLVVDRPLPAALINLCGRQRMLAERSATAWARFCRNISPRTAERVLGQTSNQFEKNLIRLQGLGFDGDLEKKLEQLQKAWHPYRKALTDEKPTLPRASRVFGLSETVLYAADQLTQAAAAHSGTPAAHRTNIAGRNRMLSQRMTKLFMFGGWGLCIDEMVAQVEHSRREFAANLDELSVVVATVPELAAQLDAVDEQWRQFLSVIDTIREQTSSSSQARAVLTAGDRLLRLADTTTNIYERLAD
jgi:CRP-like cAMP-binding protein